jgi:hypothetical protein
MTISRRFSSLVYDFLRDAAVIATYNLPPEVTEAQVTPAAAPPNLVVTMQNTAGRLEITTESGTTIYDLLDYDPERGNIWVNTDGLSPVQAAAVLYEAIAITDVAKSRSGTAITLSRSLTGAAIELTGVTREIPDTGIAPQVTTTGGGYGTAAIEGEARVGMVRRLMDDGLEEARPSLLVAAREDTKNASARRRILVNVLELVAMKTRDATAALPAQVEPDEASDILVRVNNAIRSGFSDWLALRPDAEREGYVLCKLVFTGELQTSRDADKRTVDYGVEWVFHGYCLT